MKGLLVCSIVVVVLLLASIANTVPITFIQTGTGSGILDGSTFIDDATYIIMDTDESRKLQSLSSDFFINPPTVSVDNSGFWQFVLTAETRTIEKNINGAVVFSRTRSPVTDLYVYHNLWLIMAYEYITGASSRALGFNATGLINCCYLLGDPMMRRR